MNITALYDDYKENSYQNNQINDFATASLIHTMKYFFMKYSGYILFTLSCRKKFTCEYYNDMFHKMFAEWKEWPLQIVVVNDKDHWEVPGSRQHNIIFTDSYEAFLETNIHTYVANFNNNEYYIIFLYTDEHLLFGEMQKIFEYCWKHYLINCNIQVQNSNGQVLTYTYYPFTAKYCRQVEVVLINEFNGTSLMNAKRFPNKLKNFYGCPLKLALRNVPPYLYLETDTNNITKIMGGLEGKLLLELSKKLNFSFDITVSPNKVWYNEVLENGTATGALKLLQERKADLIMGSLRQTTERRLVVSSTNSYYQTAWSVITLNEAYILTSFETITYPFENLTWYLFVLIIILVIGIAKILRWILYKNSNRYWKHITMDVISMVLGMSAQYTPVLIGSRIAIITWMMFSLIMRTTYQALLFHLIRTQITRNAPQSLEELVKRNYTLIVNPVTLRHLKMISLFDHTNFIELNSTMYVLALEYLEQQPLNNAKQMAAVLPIMYYKYYIKKYKKGGTFGVLPHIIMNFKLCAYMTKHSFLIDQLDEALTFFEDFGILDAWSLEEVDDDYDNINHIAANRTFSFEQLQTAFKLLLFGYIIAILVFILEIIYKRIISQRRRFEIFPKLHI